MAGEINYIISNAATEQTQEFEDPEKAGEAFYNQHNIDEPRVYESKGNSARMMAHTVVLGTYENGERRFSKTLPDVTPEDLEFQKGFFNALEKSVREQLENRDWKQSPQLDNELKEDLSALSARDSERAITLWNLVPPQELNNEQVKQEKFVADRNKELKLEIISNTNPAPNDELTWIRSVEDIKTAEETLTGDPDENFTYPDFSKENMQAAIEAGEITVYSSHEIENGGFVSPSKMMAQDYSGSQDVYSKKVKIHDVAWINSDEGQLAIVPEEKINDLGAVKKDSRGELEVSNEQKEQKMKVKFLNGSVREVESLQNADLRGADFSNRWLYNTGVHDKSDFSDPEHKSEGQVDYEEVSFRGSDLRGASFENAELDHADMSNTNLSGANLNHASLTDTTFMYADLQGASLRNALGEGTIFYQAELSGAQLDGAMLPRSDFEAANLNQASLKGVELGGSSFLAAKLHDADLSYVEAEHTNFEGADIDSAKFANAYLKNASFKEADISLTEFKDANLSGADFTQADIENSNFKAANLDGAKRGNTILTDINLPASTMKQKISSLFNKENTADATLKNLVEQYGWQPVGEFSDWKDLTSVEKNFDGYRKIVAGYEQDETRQMISIDEPRTHAHIFSERVNNKSSIENAKMINEEVSEWARRNYRKQLIGSVQEVDEKLTEERRLDAMEELQAALKKTGLTQPLLQEIDVYNQTVENDKKIYSVNEFENEIGKRTGNLNEKEGLLDAETFYTPEEIFDLKDFSKDKAYFTIDGQNKVHSEENWEKLADLSAMKENQLNLMLNESNAPQKKEFYEKLETAGKDLGISPADVYNATVWSASNDTIEKGTGKAILEGSLAPVPARIVNDVSKSFKKWQQEKAKARAGEKAVENSNDDLEH